MSDHPLWTIIDVRDATVERLHKKSLTLEAQLREKEQVIQYLIQVEATLREKEQIVQHLSQVETVFQEKEQVIQRLSLALREKDQIVQRLSQAETAFEKNEQVIQRLNIALREKDQIVQRLSKAEADCQEKEQVIQHLSIALQRNEADVQSLNIALRKERIVRQFLAVKIYAARPVIQLLNRSMEIISPRLGNLNQYAPRPLSVSTAFRAGKALRNMPAISIVTPSFGQGGYIEKTLQSVLDQDYPNLEYFVQDGGSDDNTVAVLQRYENRLSGWASQRDSGQSHAINLGFARTSGEIMAWLNSDDLLLPGALACVADYFSRHPEVDVVYGNRLLIDENGMEIGRWLMPGHDGPVLTWVDYVPQETMFWRRRIWDKVGGRIDESFRFAMDWDLLVRFREAGARFAHIPRFLGAFRIHEQQKTSAAINDIGHREMDRIRERVLRRVPSRREIHKAVLPFLLKHVAVDMVYRIKIRLGGRA